MFNKKSKKLQKTIEKSGLFDKVFYLKTYRDVRLADMTPIEHYATIGIKEDRKPNATFNPAWYREYYEDVKADGAYPLVHYILFGMKENRFQNEAEKNENDKLQKDGFDVELYKNTPAETSKDKLIILVGLPRSGLTLLTSILDAHSQVVSWFLPLSTRRHNDPQPFESMEDIKKQYLEAFPGQNISTCNAWVISESTSDGSNMAWLQTSLENISASSDVDIEIIWEIRSLSQTYLSQCDAARCYWGAKDLKVTAEGYQDYLNVAEMSYKNIHSFIYPYSFTLFSYEAMVRSPEKVLNNLMSQLGLEYDPNQKEYYKSFPSYKAAGDPSICENPEAISYTKVEKRQNEWMAYSFMNSKLNEKQLGFYKEFEKLSNYVQFNEIVTRNEYRKWLVKHAFEPEYYLLNNEDVSSAGTDPLEHYLTYGWKEARQPNSWFNIKAYKQNNSEIVDEPLSNYIMFGRFNEADTVEEEVGIYENLIVIDPETYEITPDLMLEAPYYENPLVSIIIPAYNQEKYTLACIESIIRHTENDVTYEIVIMDDKSPDESARVIGKYMKNILFHSNEENLGFLRNCNNGAKFANGKYILFLNNDTNVQPGWLSSLVILIESADDIGMVGSRLVYPTGQQQEAGGIIWKDGSGWNFGHLDDPNKPEYNYVKEADYLTGAAMMIKHSLWLEIGGFDERYVPAYFEDSDLAFEVRKHGYRTLYQPKSVVIHFEGISHGTDTGTGIKRYQVLNREKFIEKWKPELEHEHFDNGQQVFLARDRSRFKKHLLMIDHYVPHFDQDAGSRTVFGYLKMFIEDGFKVTFIGDNFFPHQPYTEELQQLGVEVLYGNWYARNWENWWAENGHYYDYVFLNRPHISEKYIDKISIHSSAKILYYGHDLHFLREKREYLLFKDETKLRSSLELQKQEISLMKKSDLSIYPSEIEVNEIHKIDENIRAQSMPAYLFTNFTEEERDIVQTHDVMFVGGFGHTPNIDAVLWFVKNVWPKVIDKYPGIKFYIIGSKPSEEILNLASDDIIVTGFVSDEVLEQHYKESRIAVVPLRYGAGIKGKVVEALYNQIPIVTTSVGAEGLENAEEYMSIEDDADTFADEINRLYDNLEDLEKMSQQGKKYCQKYFSYNAAKQSLSSIIEFNKKGR